MSIYSSELFAPPKESCWYNASKRRGSFGFTHGKYDKYMSMVIAAQVVTCLLLLTFSLCQKVTETLQLHHFLQSPKTCLLFLQANKQKNPTLELVPILSFGVGGMFIYLFILNLVAHFPFKYWGQLDMGLVRSVLSVYSCVYPFWKEAGFLKFLMRTWAVALKNIYRACILQVLYIYSIKMANTLIQSLFFLCVMEVVFLISTLYKAICSPVGLLNRLYSQCL